MQSGDARDNPTRALERATRTLSQAVGQLESSSLSLAILTDLKEPLPQFRGAYDQFSLSLSDGTEFGDVDSGSDGS